MTDDRPGPTLARPMRGTGRLVAAAAVPLLLAAGLWAGLPGCDRQPPAAGPEATSRPAPGDTLLVVDGVTITFADVAEAVADYDRRYPEYNERIKIQKALTQDVLPLVFARREFAAERAHQLGLARTFRGGCGNVEELANNVGDRPHRRATLVAGDFEQPVARFLFEPTNVGAVSEPLEVPQGFIVAGAFDLVQEREVIKDRCDALQVMFPTHSAAAFGEWLQALRTRLGPRVTYVHKDYRLAMPPWLKVP